MKNNSQNKELTLSDIAELINATKTNLEAKIETSVHELTTMNQNQFLALEKKIGNVEQSVEEVKLDVRELQSDITEVKSDIRELKTNMKDVKANLHKKVDKIDHNTLTYRVEKLAKNFA